MTAARRGRRWALLAALLAASGCFTPCCHKIYELHRGGDPDASLNILFVGDGFDETSLQSYRAATRQLTNGLLATAPFCNLRDRINVYRIDVRDPNAATDPGGSICDDVCPAFEELEVHDSFREPTAPEAIRSGTETLRRDFKVGRCWTRTGSGNGPCRLMWMTPRGEFNLRGVSRCAPNVSVVVVVANTRVTAGAGRWRTSEASEPVVVVGVPMVEDAVGDWALTPTAHSLFAHELGHALDLVDEYVGAVADSPEPPVDRNVWMPTTSPPWSAANETIPWKDVLEPGCSPETLAPCCGALSFVGCQSCAGTGEPESKCPWVPWYCQNEACSDCPVPASCADNVGTNSAALCLDLTTCGQSPGAWEGAVYRAQGAYRPAWTCQMETTSPAPFCDACVELMWQRHFCRGDECSHAFPHPATCPSLSGSS